MMYRIITFFIIIYATNQAVVAQKNDAKWDVEKVYPNAKTLEFNTNEGTWMNLDVHPNGSEIIFDLLGDIYKIPINGGNATLLAGGLAWEVQPRYSPDGKYISYTSDKNGADNIWMMNADGTNPHAVTKENFRLLNNAVWTSNGKYLIARKHFTGTRSLGAGELWMYHTIGGLDGVQLTKRKNDQQDLGEPCTTKDGPFVYYSEDVSPGPIFQYNKDPYGEIYAIKRLNLETNEVEKITGGAGGAVRPQVSPDGKLLAFVKRDRLKSVLYIHDLQTGEEFPVYNELSKDQQEAWAIFGVYPNFAWLPDNNSVVIYAKGKLRKVNITTYAVEDIPFNVTVNQKLNEALSFNHKAFSEEFDSKMIRQLCTSPDGKRVVFNAAGYLYIKDLPNGVPQKLTTGTDWEFEPSFSLDGKSIVYINWNDDQLGSVMRFDLKSKKSKPITTEKGYYNSPQFNRQGDKIVYRKGVGNDVLGFTYGKDPGIYVYYLANDQIKLVSKQGIKPKFNQAGDRIYFQSFQDNKKAFMSCDIHGSQMRTHFTSTYATDFIPSPDDEWISFNELFNVYVTPLLQTGSGLDLSSQNKSLPIKKVSKNAGNYIHWSADSKFLHWTSGPKYFTQDISSSFSSNGDVVNTTAASDSLGIDIGLKLKSDIPNGKIALKGARIITMEGNEVINNGTIVISGNKIEAVGNTEDVDIPNNALIYDVSGKTIMPGIIDVHAHLRTSPDGVSPKQDWSYYANLAYGVTTSHDPSTNTEMVFSQSEMIKAGRMVGPRVFSTGTILYGAEGDFKAVINNIDDARNHLSRMKAVGAFSVKSYNQPRREQRQQIIQAARELNMLVVPEGGCTFFSNMTMIADGHTGVEHNIPVTPVYKDVLNYWNASKTGYTPTLIVAYGSQMGENYWYDRTNVWENEQLLKYVPKFVVDARSRRRTTSEYGDYGHLEIAKATADLAKGGTKVNLGAHGQLQGLGAHWELWMLGQGGMKPLEAIKCATINGASYLGLEKQLGSITKGKLADLIVLDANPLEDIRNTDQIKYTMINGRLYDVETMNEIGNTIKNRNKFWFQNQKNENYIIPEGFIETHNFTVPNCD